MGLKGEVVGNNNEKIDKRSEPLDAATLSKIEIILKKTYKANVLRN